MANDILEAGARTQVSVFMRFLAAALLAICALNARAQPLILSCTLDDEASARFCARSPDVASACQRSFLVDDARKTVEAVNPGRILPPFTVEDWSPNAIHLVQRVTIPESKARHDLHTLFDRITGRMTVSHRYVDGTTGGSLETWQLDALAADQVRRFGLLGNLERVPEAGTCKAVNRAF